MGRDVKDVEAELKALGLKVSKEKLDNDGTHEENTVESLSPTDDLQEGDTISVQYWDKPAPVVPDPTDTATESGTASDTTTEAPAVGETSTSESAGTEEGAE